MPRGCPLVYILNGDAVEIEIHPRPSLVIPIALLAVTFVAFASSGVTFIKLFALGLALAVLMDATIVRALLVPALMKLAGEANWWAPAPLRRFQQRFGLHEAPDDEPGPPPVVTSAVDLTDIIDEDAERVPTPA